MNSDSSDFKPGEKWESKEESASKMSAAAMANPTKYCNECNKNVGETDTICGNSGNRLRNVLLQPTQAAMDRVAAASSLSTAAATYVPSSKHLHGSKKTELCNKWKETGECPYGDKCQFAHGIGELQKDRRGQRHPEWKTKKCGKWHKEGRCPYGKRCHFIHDETPEQLRKMKGLDGGYKKSRKKKRKTKRKRRITRKRRKSRKPRKRRKSRRK